MTTSTEPRGAVMEAILAALAEHGPMTRADLREEVGKPDSDVARALGRLVKQERVHFPRFERAEINGMKMYPRAVYAVGPGKNARRLARMPGAERSRRQYAKRKKRVSSVWQLAVAPEHRA